MNAYLKAITAVLGAVLTSLAIYYGNTHWYPVVTAAVTALSVYLVPNLPKSGTTTKVDINSAYPQNMPVKTDWTEVPKS